jgi:LmbE family N-acetylglucosaminyl deacetylase
VKTSLRAIAVLFFLPLAVTPLRSGEPDARLKADILLVTAHPDDDTLVASYLARSVYDEGRRVVVTICTDGAGGGNAAGPERGAALGLVRRLEARRALATLGIDAVWFLDGRDTPSQDVLYSLAGWGHGAVLEELVRLVRLTRPEVMLTWLPRNVAGENHGDHQAAGVVATEAFDLAGDPAAFPAQLSAMRRPMEGLETWWPKKLYYFTDAFDTEFLRGKGPEYPLRERSRTRGVSHAELALREARLYETQLDGLLPAEAVAALDRGEADQAIDRVLEAGLVTDPLRLMLGKSRVDGRVGGDVFDAIVAGPILPGQAPAPERFARKGVTLELGGSWSFYLAFWRAHGLGSLAELGPPEMALRPGQTLQVPLLIHNDTDAAVEATVTLGPVAQGWRERPRADGVRVPARSTSEIESFVETPGQASATFSPVTYELRVAGRTLSSTTLRVRLHAETMPQ